MKASKTYMAVLWAAENAPVLLAVLVLVFLVLWDRHEKELCAQRGHQQGYIAKLLSGECYFNVHPNLWATEEDYKSVTKINPLKEVIDGKDYEIWNNKRR